MDDAYSLPPLRRWPLVLAVLATLLWIALAVIAFLPLIPGIVLLPVVSTAARIAGGVLALSAPVAIIWLVAANLRDLVGSRAQRTALMAEHAGFTEQKLDQGARAMDLLEDRMAQLVGRINAVAFPIDRQQQSLEAAAGRFESNAAQLVKASELTETAAVALGRVTPDVESRVQSLTAQLARAEADLLRQVAEADRLLAALNERAAAAEAQVRATASETGNAMAAITDASRRAQESMAVPLRQLVENTDAALARTAAAMDTTRDGVHAQTNAMLASVDQARVTLDHIGGEAARQIKARLDTLLQTAGEIGSLLETNAAGARDLIDDINRSFSVLDAKLANSANTGNAALDNIAARMTEAREAIHRLGEPISTTDSALAAVEARLATVGRSVDDTLGSLGTALPAAMPQLENMAIRLSELHDRADQLSLPLTAGGDSIAQAQAQLDRAREALDTAAAKLGQELTTARNALSDIETLTGSTSLAASSQLIEVFGRVKDIANQTAGTMRETLSNVVAEAEAALDQAGASRAELAFGAPIRAKLVEVEALHERVAEAAQAASERVTRRLLALTETVADVEARIDEADTKFEVRARNTLAARSNKLIASMQDAAIDIAALLSFDMEDTAWDNYLKGDRSIFARRLVQALDANGTRAIARHYQHDPEFRQQAVRYMDEFELLIAQVLPDREGRSLAVTLLSSSLGKLYVAIGQAVDRFV
jgi:predicted  nucleic acid-binding Zn-ribbon protein